MRRLYDKEVHEVFEIFGVNVAIYFEAIRYRQQLTPNKFFPFRREDIKKRTDLTIKQQERIQPILRETGWIETKRGFNRGGGTITQFRVSDMAKDLLKHIPRKHDTSELKLMLLQKWSS